MKSTQSLNLDHRNIQLSVASISTRFKRKLPSLRSTKSNLPSRRVLCLDCALLRKSKLPRGRRITSFHIINPRKDPSLPNYRLPLRAGKATPSVAAASVNQLTLSCPNSLMSAQGSCDPSTSKICLKISFLPAPVATNPILIP
jgi:hypothetical protein